ncbi:MAG: hypothetical protein ACKOC5_00820, partial [Chloroflexota bacterium]
MDKPPDTDLPVSAASPWWAKAAAGLLLAYELAWVLPWYRVLMESYSAPPAWLGALALGGVMLAAYLLSALMGRLRLVRNLQLGVLLGLLVVGLFTNAALLLRGRTGLIAGLVQIEIDVLYTALFTSWMWLRGYTLYFDGIRPAVVWRRFRLGLFAFMAYIFYAYQWRLAAPGLLSYVAFLFTGLLAVIVTRIAYVWIARGGRRSPFDRRWLGAILVSLLLVLLLSAALGSLLSGQYRFMLDLAGELVRLATVVGLFLLSLPVILFSFILFPLVNWVQNWFNSLPQAPEELLAAPSAYPYPMAAADTSPSQALITASALCFWAAFLVIAAVLYLRARRAIVRQPAPELDAPEWILGRGELALQARKALQEGW